MKFLKKRPDAPQNRFAESADMLMLLAMFAGYGCGIVAYGLGSVVDLLAGRVETPTWIGTICFMAVGLAAAFGCCIGLKVYRKRLTGFAPVDGPYDPGADLTNLAEAGGWNDQAHGQIDNRDINFVDRAP